MTKLNRIMISLSDDELAALDYICTHYGFSRSRMLAELTLQSKRKVENTPALEEQLVKLEDILKQFEDTQTRISGGDGK